MAVTFTLKDARRDRSYIQILVRFRGQFYRKSTGETIPVQYWNPRKHRCSVSREFAAGNTVNAVLDRWESAANEAMLHFKTLSGTPTSPDFWKAVERIMYKGTNEKTAFIDYLEEYIAQQVESVKRPNTAQNYRTALHKLQQYEKESRRRLFFEDINMDFYNRLHQWMAAAGYSDNYFGTIIKIIKHILREAHYAGLCDELRGIEHRDFVTINKPSDNIYLTLDELKRIYEVELTLQAVQALHPAISELQVQKRVRTLELVRERFIIGAFTGLRVSDFGRLNDAYIGTDVIRIKTRKTGADVVIPMHPYIRAIIDRGFDASIHVPDARMNALIKEVARIAGIDDEVVVTRNAGGRDVPHTFRKYELVCTHTARRSFATNAYKAGVPTIAIMKITGHTQESTFLRYIKVSAEENAEMLAKHPFFTL